MLSNNCLKIVDKYGLKAGGVKKLVPNLGKKSNYITHYMNLKLHLSLGMKLIKIYKILKFKQAPWIKKYIDFNTEKGENAGSEFEKTLLKLMINSAYGKTMKNLRNRMNIKLENNSEDYLKHINEIQPALLLKKPIYVGFIVLELSKYLMYDFHYNFIKQNFDANLLFTDTDSLTYIIYYTFSSINTCLVLVKTNQDLMIQLIKQLLVRWKMNLQENLSENMLG